MNDCDSSSSDERPPTLGIGYFDPDSTDDRKFSPNPDSAVATSTTWQSLENFNSNHEKIGPIGSGGNGSVYLYEHNKTKKKVAVKIMPIDQENEAMMRKNFLEGRLLKDIPHMVRYRKMFYRVDLGKCYLIMNYYNFPKLSTKGDYSEEDLKIIVKQVLTGLKALHKNSFYHRDIKPDNILYDREKKNAIIVDLGVGRKVKGEGAFSVTGTLNYRAPEMTIKGYTSKVDIWALGITIYEMVTGTNPSNRIKNIPVNVQELTELKKKDFCTFHEPKWKQYDPLLQDLVKRMLRILPDERQDARSCLKHAWFVKESPDVAQKSTKKPHEKTEEQKISKSLNYDGSQFDFRHCSIGPSKPTKGQKKVQLILGADQIQNSDDEPFEQEEGDLTNV